MHLVAECPPTEAMRAGMATTGAAGNQNSNADKGSVQCDGDDHKMQHAIEWSVFVFRPLWRVSARCSIRQCSTLSSCSPAPTHTVCALGAQVFRVTDDSNVSQANEVSITARHTELHPNMHPADT